MCATRDQGVPNCVFWVSDACTRSGVRHMDGVWAPAVDTGVTVNATGGCALVCAPTGVLFGMCATRGKGVLN